MNVLVWYKRDLRVEDHPALSLAAQGAAVLPLYIVEPGYWAGPDTSARQWGFVAETLVGLRRDLARLGAPLVVRVGDAVEVLARFCGQNNITRIVSHREAGNGWSVARDRRVAVWARDAGIDWVELAQDQRRVDDELNIIEAPTGLRMVAGIEPGVIPTARALRMAADACPHLQSGGRAQGLALLDSFLAQRGRAYRQAIRAPLSAERTCSRLSPYLAIGALSAREVEQTILARQETRPGPDWVASLRAFKSRIAWRACLLAETPRIDTQPPHRGAVALPGRMADGARFEAWVRGETGLPYLDACMRYLAATGWINFRARAMLTSVATHHLWLDWQAVGHVLARRFTDYDPGIHWPQIQIHAGVSGAKPARVIDPIKEGLAQDPLGLFTRRWVPELATVPDAFLQCPWKWPGAQSILGWRYPEPVVDVATAARAARHANGSQRMMEEPQGDTVQILDRPARPTQRRARPAPVGQLCLDI